MPQQFQPDVRVIDPRMTNMSQGQGLFAPALGALAERGIASLFPSAQDDYYRAQASYMQNLGENLRGDNIAKMLSRHQYNYQQLGDPAARASYAKEAGYDESVLATAHPDSRRMIELQQMMTGLEGRGPGAASAAPQPIPMSESGGASAAVTGATEAAPGAAGAKTADGTDLTPFEAIAQLPKHGATAVGSPGFAAPPLASYKGPEDVIWSVYPRGSDAEQMQLRNWQDNLPIAQQARKMMMTANYFGKWMAGETPDPLDMSQFHQTVKGFEEQLIKQTAERGELDPYALAVAASPENSRDAMYMFMAASQEGREYLKARGVSDADILKASQNPVIAQIPPGSRNNLFKNFLLPRMVFGVEAMDKYVDQMKKLSEIDMVKAEIAFRGIQGQFIEGPQSFLTMSQARGLDAQTAQVQEITSQLPARLTMDQNLNAAQIAQWERQADLALRQINQNFTLGQLGLLNEANKTRLTVRAGIFENMMETLRGRGSAAAGTAESNAVLKSGVQKLDMLSEMQIAAQKAASELSAELAKSEAMGIDPSKLTTMREQYDILQARSLALYDQVTTERMQVQQATGYDPVDVLKKMHSEYAAAIYGEMDETDKFNAMVMQSMTPDGKLNLPKWPGSNVPITTGRDFQKLQDMPLMLGQSLLWHQARYGKPLPFAEWVTAPIGPNSAQTPATMIPSEADLHHFYNKYYWRTQTPMRQGPRNAGMDGSSPVAVADAEPVDEPAPAAPSSAPPSVRPPKPPQAKQGKKQRYQKYAETAPQYAVPAARAMWPGVSAALKGPETIAPYAQDALPWLTGTTALGLTPGGSLFNNYGLFQHLTETVDE